MLTPICGQGPIFLLQSLQVHACSQTRVCVVQVDLLTYPLRPSWRPYDTVATKEVTWLARRVSMHNACC